MDRTKNDFDRYKITQAATDKVCTAIYVDANCFEHEKVKIKNCTFGSDYKEITCNLNFEDLAVLAEDCRSGRIFDKVMKADSNGYIISRGGSKKSKNYNGAPESRIITLKMSSNKQNIFLNMSRSKGEIGKNGIIKNVEKPDLVIGVPIPLAKFRSMMIYAYDWVRAYLPVLVVGLYKESAKKAEEYHNSKSSITEVEDNEVDIPVNEIAEDNISE